MFSGCTSLTSTPDLSKIVSVSDNGLNSMFSGCTNLTSAKLPYNILQCGIGGCYKMFNSCTSLRDNTPMLITSISSWSYS